MENRNKIEKKMSQIRDLLTLALAAVSDDKVLEKVADLALSQPDIEWEPFALANAALIFKREIDDLHPEGASLPGAPEMPNPDSEQSPGPAEKIFLPKDPRL